ncbi:sugar (and other) transporter family protein [Burkholderia cepacia]|nr:sugar (and other) transporter family protein [Burkholderia cepacia]
MIGTSLEWYDFTIYNTLAALVFNHLFFPSVDPLAGTILAFSTYAVGYVSRPLGGFVFGNLGDRIGRRAVLMLTLVLMGVTTALMGALPTYAQAGILSPILLVALRFVQGVALGGEWAGAVLLSVEHGDQKRRGLSASWTQIGPSFGTLLGTGCIALVTLSTTSGTSCRGAGACRSRPARCSSCSVSGCGAASTKRRSSNSSPNRTRPPRCRSRTC